MSVTPWKRLLIRRSHEFARAGLTAVVITFVFAAIVFMLWLGAKVVLGGQMTAGQLSEFTSMWCSPRAQ